MSTVRALVDCYVGTSTGPRRLHGGDEFDENDALVRGNPSLFSEPAPEPVAESKRPTLKVRDRSGA